MLASIISFIFFVVFTQATIIPNNIKQQLVQLNTTISDRSCSFYTEFEKLVPCGDDGYVVTFARHYCQIYLDNRNDFSDKDWQDTTRRCLQQKLYEYTIKQQNYPSCNALEEFGFDSHVGCYEKPDETRPKITFCDIPFMDKMKIIWLIGNGPFLEMLRSAAALKFCL